MGLNGPDGPNRSMGLVWAISDLIAILKSRDWFLRNSWALTTCSVVRISSLGFHFGPNKSGVYNFSSIFNHKFITNQFENSILAFILRFQNKALHRQHIHVCSQCQTVTYNNFQHLIQNNNAGCYCQLSSEKKKLKHFIKLTVAIDFLLIQR